MFGWNAATQCMQVNTPLLYAIVQQKWDVCNLLLERSASTECMVCTKSCRACAG